MEKEVIISQYTDSEAVEDGHLFDLIGYHSAWKDGPFTYVTNNLLVKGNYLVKDQINAPALSDLLLQCARIKFNADKKKGQPDYFYSGSVELPSGKKQKVFMGANETGKLTIMLPEDY